MTLSSDIQAYINNAAAQFNNVDPAFLSAVAQIESGGNPNAQSSGSSASGLFQFTRSTAAQYGLTNVFDPQASANAAAALASNNYNALSGFLGTAPSGWQQYLAYQQGVGGAKALLGADPQLPAISALQNAGVSSGIAYQSIVNNGGSANMSTGDFLKVWENKFNSVASGTSAAGTGTAQGIAGTGAAGSSTAPKVTGIAWIDAIINWLVSLTTRISIFVIGIVLIGGGLFLFGGHTPALNQAIATRVVGVPSQNVTLNRPAKKVSVIHAPAKVETDRGLGLGGKNNSSPPSNVFAMQKAARAAVAMKSRKA